MPPKTKKRKFLSPFAVFGDRNFPQWKFRFLQLLKRLSPLFSYGCCIALLLFCIPFLKNKRVIWLQFLCITFFITAEKKINCSFKINKLLNPLISLLHWFMYFWTILCIFITLNLSCFSIFFAVFSSIWSYDTLSSLVLFGRIFFWLTWPMLTNLTNFSLQLIHLLV